MRQNPHVRICGGPGSATTLVYPTPAGQGDYRTNEVLTRRAAALPVRVRIVDAWAEPYLPRSSATIFSRSRA